MGKTGKKYIAFLMASVDGKDIAQAREVEYCLVSSARNTVYQEDFLQNELNERSGSPLELERDD